MSNFLTLFISLLISSTLVSCGVKKNSKADLDSTNAYVNAIVSSRSCSSDSIAEFENKVKEVEKSLESIQVLAPKYRLKKYKKSLQSLQLEPMVLSQTIFKTRILNLEEEVSEKLSSSISNKELRGIRKKIKKIRIDLERWAFHQCHLRNLIDNDDQEINNFIELESSMCEGDCENSLMPEIVLTDLETREKAISVCSLFNRVNQCRVQYDIATIYNNEKEFISNILVKAKKFFNKEVFGMEDSPLDIECVNGEKKELTIPIYQNENSVSLMNAISENWKADNIEIKYKIGNSGARLELVSNGLSRVELDNRNTIYLNKDVVGVERVKTIAHEFGHTLGFKDCYIEYFDAKSSEVVYYELERDKGNLMCSLQYGTNIPEKYLEKVVSKYCK